MSAASSRVGFVPGSRPYCPAAETTAVVDEIDAIPETFHVVETDLMAISSLYAFTVL